MNDTVSKSNHRFPKTRVNIGLGLTFAGFLIFILGADPGLVGLDRSLYIGFVQTATFSFGLAMLCLGGFLCFKACQQTNSIQSLAQDIGVRLVATGYVISLISAMADVFGFGTQSWPAPPFFGPQQAAGVIVGEIIIAIGFILYMPFLSKKA